ncbi:MAG TPA: GNAT family N-acetyltransferase [Candidatus Dormibacteraeota bacterium]|nr:GNAT family N-acetyltransferase [Candidatus Dormibacteraeota bacterium]
MSPGGATIRQLRSFAELRELEALLAGIWERPAEPPVNIDLLRALAHSGNYVAGARIDGRLVGGLVGWLGTHAAGELHLHSHILGVVVGSQVGGVGFVLKQDQRRWCLERGVKTIEWTTDPLVRRNAYFNLTKLGARASDYLVNFYGAMTDSLNAGEESDRLLITWDLESSAARSAAEGHAFEPDLESLRRDGAAVALAVGTEGEPVAGERSSARVLICQVPEDIVATRHATPAIAHAWRLALRRVLGDAVQSGYSVTGATRTGWYVLEGPSPE